MLPGRAGQHCHLLLSLLTTRRLAQFTKFCIDFMSKLGFSKFFRKDRFPGPVRFALSYPHLWIQLFGRSSSCLRRGRGPRECFTSFFVRLFLLILVALSVMLLELLQVPSSVARVSTAIIPKILLQVIVFG